MSLEQALRPKGQALARPVSRTMVLASLLAAFLLSVMPWPKSALWLQPDFLLLVLVYWGIHSPRQAPMGLAFFIGLVMDAAQGLLFGLHALSYCSAMLVVLLLRRRLENFTPFGQALQLAWLFPAQSSLALLHGLVFGYEPDWRYLLAGLATALLWLPVGLLLDRLTERPSPADTAARMR